MIFLCIAMDFSENFFHIALHPLLFWEGGSKTNDNKYELQGNIICLRCALAVSRLGVQLDG